VWSVGVVIHRLISGDKLFSGATEKSVANAVTRSPLFVADESEGGFSIDLLPLLYIYFYFFMVSCFVFCNRPALNMYSRGAVKCNSSITA
jgi:hypothetical protein